MRMLTTPYSKPNPFRVSAKRTSLSGKEIESEYAIKEYERLLAEVHPNFCKKLIQRAPELTPMELRVCMLTRAFVGIKECAEILSVSKSSIESHRWHARCKLGIENRAVSLTTALHGI
jgi:DNA-binding CsgD family transcriptional regulator